MPELGKEEIKKELSFVIAKQVSRVWRGHGTFIALEIGELHNNEEGDWTLELEGDWKMYKGNQEIADSINDDLKALDYKIQALKELTIKSINLSEDSKSASVFFDNDMGITISVAEYGFMSLANFDRKRALVFEPDGKVKIEY